MSHPSWGAWIEIRISPAFLRCSRSHPSWGAWIEISFGMTIGSDFFRRTPHGVRGLKYGNAAADGRGRPSHPSWGAWIEIALSFADRRSQSSHPSWGAWIEILLALPMAFSTSRTPHGVRGLKWTALYCPPPLPWSHPSWGAWIEIKDGYCLYAGLRSHPSWGAWIEITFPASPLAGRPCRTPHGVRGLKSS